MAKVKLSVKNLEIFKEAAQAADVTVLEENTVGDYATVLVQYKHASQIFSLGIYFENCNLKSDGKQKTAK